MGIAICQEVAFKPALEILQAPSLSFSLKMIDDSAKGTLSNP